MSKAFSDMLRYRFLHSQRRYVPLLERMERKKGWRSLDVTLGEAILKEEAQCHLSLQLLWPAFLLFVTALLARKSLRIAIIAWDFSLITLHLATLQTIWDFKRYLKKENKDILVIDDNGIFDIVVVTCCYCKFENIGNYIYRDIWYWYCFWISILLV